MKIGILTGIWFIAEQASIIASLNRAAALGFHYVDVHGLFLAGPNHLTEKQRKEVKSEIDALGLVASSYILHSPISVPSTNQKELEDCFRYLCEAVDLAVEWVTNCLAALLKLDIDKKVKRFGCDELVISLELGVPTDKIDDPDDWIRRSVDNIQQMYPAITQ